MLRINQSFPSLKQNSNLSKTHLTVFATAFAGIGLAVYFSLAALNPSLPGDLNGDNTVDASDLSILLSDFGTSNAAADINGDGTVDVLDLSILLSNYGQSYTSYLFDDEFNGAANAPPDASKWTFRGAVCDIGAYSCFKDSNIFQNGGGDLVLRVQRESSNYLTGGPYSGAFMSTFNYGSGWPPTGIKASFPVPFHIDVRALMPETPGAWPALWLKNTNYTAAQGMYELDVGEERLTYPTTGICHSHFWVNGTDQNPWGSQLTVSDMGQNWHDYSADVYSDHVTYYVDGAACGTSYGATGQFGINLDNILGTPGSWGSGGQEPAASDPGPWDMLVDYIRVTAL